ncbi:MAG: type IV secretion system protein TraC, partial [Pseudomonadota bacterium]
MMEKLGQLIAKLLGEDVGCAFNTGSAKSFWDLCVVPRIFDHLPYEGYDAADGLFINRETTGFILQGDPVVGASLADQEQLSDFFRQADNLPEGSSLQFLLYASPKIGALLDYWSSNRQESLQKLTQRRVQFLSEKAFAAEDGFLVRDYRLLISFSYPEKVTDLMERHRIVQIREVLKGYLGQIGLPTKTLDADGLLREIGAILNFREVTNCRARNYDSRVSLNRQVLDKNDEWVLDKDGIKLARDTYSVKSFVPKDKPRYWALGHMDKFLGDIFKPQQKLSCAFLLHYGLYVTPGQGNEKRKAFSKRESLENSLKNRMTKWVPGIEEEFAEFKEITEQLQLGERVVQAGLSCTIFCKSAQVQSAERQLGSIWRNGGWSLQPATYDHLSVLLASMPMMWTLGTYKKSLGFKEEITGAASVLERLGRIEKTITREAQNMLPIVGEWKGQIAPGMPLIGRRGQLFFWNPFDGMLLPGKDLPSQTANYNLCISGKSGSGKSFFCNELIVNTLATGGKAFVLDKGNSFKNMCLILGGHHIDFSANTNHCLNPFTHIPEGAAADEIEERSEQLNIVVQVLKTMAMPTREPDEIQSSFLEEAVAAVWQARGASSCINDVQQWLVNHVDSRAQDLGRMLLKFTGCGKYANFFNRPATVNLKHDFVVIETQNLMNHEELRAVLVQMMIVQVCQKMVSSDRRQAFLVLIDEAWELIQGVASGKFIAAFVRTARKYRASLALATQNISDFFRKESPGATVAFENSDWKCIFKQESLSFVEKLGRAEAEQNLAKKVIGSLLPASSFSEFAIFGQEVRGVVGRLFCDQFSGLLYSTKAQDYAEIVKFKNQGLGVEESIESVLAERHGCAAAFV